jgi:hypothetical protein
MLARCACGRGQRLPGEEECEACSSGRAPRRALARAISFDDCDAGQQASITEAHRRGKEMLKEAQDKLDAYDGTSPAEVRTGLQHHFNSTSTWVAWVVKDNIRSLRGIMALRPDPQYECQAEASGSTHAWVPWCVPFADIEVYPAWFGGGVDERASTLIHEWFHKYLCKLDVGYDWEEGYADQSTLRHLTNADSYGEFIDEVT